MEERNNSYIEKFSTFINKEHNTIIREQLLAFFLANNRDIPKLELDKIIKEYFIDRVILEIECRKLGLDKRLKFDKFRGEFYIVRNRSTGEFSIRNKFFIRGHERKFNQIGDFYNDCEKLLKDFYDYKYFHKELPQIDKNWKYYAIDAGNNPETSTPWIEIRKFKNKDEAYEFNKSSSQSRYTDPIELSTDYYRSVGMLVTKYSYPKHAIKNLNI
jgi:hypothetical protein